MRDRARFYRIVSELPSVTTVIGDTKNKADVLVPWAVRKLRERVHDVAVGTVLGTTVPSVEAGVALLTAIASDPAEEEASASRNFGTAVHKWIESYCLGIITERGATAVPLDPYERGATDAFLEWADKVEMVPIAVEREVSCVQCGYAGRVDLYAWTGTKAKRARTIVDLKTSKRVYPEHLLQVAAYQHAGSRSGLPNEAGLVLRLPRGPGATWQAVPVPTLDHGVFLGAIRLWRWYRDQEGLPGGR